VSEAEQVVVRVPATTRHVALIRATASSLAALADLSYDRITDLHIAIDEVCSRILATSHPKATRLEVRFTVEKDGILVHASGDSGLREGAEFLNAWSRAILEAITDGLEVGPSDGSSVVSFRVAVG
jgi:serine/threonine-protein kinase RsbW